MCLTQNNLAELWSLLNFVLPDIFSDLYTFQEWYACYPYIFCYGWLSFMIYRFNLPEMQASAPSARSSRVIHSLHAILRPFLLRRLKADVEANLPPKKEYVLYAPLSQRQHEVYDAIVQGGLRALLLQERGAKGRERVAEEEKPDLSSGDKDEKVATRTRSKKRGRPAKKEKRYDVDGDDDEYFEKLESGELEAMEERKRLEKAQQLGQDWQYKTQREHLAALSRPLH